MDLMKFNKACPPDLDELEKVGCYLLRKLSENLSCKLEFFKIHLVDNESFVGTFRAEKSLIEIFDIEVEGVVLYQVTEHSPNINSEVLLFSSGLRMGLKKHKGESFIILDFDGDKWVKKTWMRDDVGEWLSVDELRISQYKEFHMTVDSE